MYKLIGKEDNKFIIERTSDGATSSHTPEELCNILYSNSFNVEGIIQNNNEIVFPDYNVKYKRVFRGSRFRLYPNKEQRIMLNKIFGCCRFIWNKMLSERIDYYTIYGEPLENHYNDYYDDNEFLREVPARSLQMTERNLNAAYKNFFSRVSKGDAKAGFPKFKKKSNKQSYQIYNDHNNIRIKDGRVRISKVGDIKLIQHRPISGRIMTVTVTKTTTDKYYISMNTEEWIKVSLTKSDKTVGVDLGIKDLAILDDGTKIPNPKTLDKYLDQLRFYQQKLSRTQKGSNRRKKLQHKINVLHEKIRNIRVDNIHKFTKQMIDENQVIITEDLNVAGMISNKTHKKSRRTRSRHIADASWCEITRQLQYKSSWHDKTYKKVGRSFPSTQLCHVCGYQNTQLRGNTSIREWTCPCCSTHHDRDINAAINIRHEGLRLLNTA